ncbi:MAG: ABC transporter permease [Candidatus Nanopelagicales bacterium]|jgi:ABC-type polysaccharide/polyol phosphate export permease|nr:ABC transporter permease [Candidatus Nanopelagicales bacterium]
MASTLETGTSTPEAGLNTFSQRRQDSPRARARLIWAFALRDLRARFTATRLGLLWTLIVPLATVLIYSTVFSVIFRAQAPPMGNGEPGVFAVWFFVGLVAWNVFAQATGGAMGSILGMGAMLQKVSIPAFVPVLASVTTILIEKMLEVSVLLLVLLVFLNVGWTWLLYPLVFVATGVFAAGLGYCLAVAMVHFRDTGQIFGIMLQLWFFLTPIMYPIEMIPEDWNGVPLQSLFALNPMTHFVEISRDLLYDLTLPTLGSVTYALVWMAVALGGAVLVHRRYGRDVSEAI